MSEQKSRSSSTPIIGLQLKGQQQVHEPTAHPEAFCQRCRRPNVLSWHAPSPLWNRVMRDSVTGEDRYSVVCPPCFAEQAVVLIGDAVWCFKPHDVDVAGLWVDADGRTWNPYQCLWVGK